MVFKNYNEGDGDIGLNSTSTEGTIGLNSTSTEEIEDSDNRSAEITII